MLRRLLLLSGVLLAGGCSWPVREATDQAVLNLVNHPFDTGPETAESPASATPTSSSPAREESSPSRRPDAKPAAVPEVPPDTRTTALMDSPSLPDPAGPKGAMRDDKVVLAAAWMETQAPPGTGSPPSGSGQRKLDLNIPPQLPGSEAPRIVLPTERAEVDRAIERVYPELPPLPLEPKPLPGPAGRAYTLADLQRLAAANSPALRQAASDVEAARGNLIQAMTYPNPTFAYLIDPTNNNATAGVQGGYIDQVIKTGGKLKLGVAAAAKDLDSSLLALKRARSDLSTAVRNAYFTLLVDVETLVVTRALAQFTDDIYRLQTGLLKGAQAAPYEPASLRAQAFTTRLAYRQAIASYVYDWKALVATIGMPHLPLSALAGRVDRLIPYYDYDQVLAHVLKHHTDILTAQNDVKKAQYLLKLAQVTPLVPDVEVQAHYERDFTVAPFGQYGQFAMAVPLPIWDQNKGNIIAAQAALVRASEESHNAAVTLTNNLATAYSGYKNNLYAMEYYRRYILPDLVRYYRGVFARRQIDPSSAFGDLVFAQQNLASNVTSYIGVLGALWTSVVSVADFLQTDDLFQQAEPHPLPELPDFNQLRLMPCGHETLAAAYTHGAEPGDPGPTFPAGTVPPGAPMTPAPGPPAPGGMAAPPPAAEPRGAPGPGPGGGPAVQAK
jgi:cobalt-zinc-cadmium efflux system outer membrane protein